LGGRHTKRTDQDGKNAKDWCPKLKIRNRLMLPFLLCVTIGSGSMMYPSNLWGGAYHECIPLLGLRNIGGQFRQSPILPFY